MNSLKLPWIPWIIGVPPVALLFKGGAVAIVALVAVGCDLLWPTDTATPPGSEAGSIRVVSTPAGATIHLDNRDTGHTTPATLNAAPGLHSVQLTKGDLSWARSELDVVVGKTLQVNAELTATGARRLTVEEYADLPARIPTFDRGEAATVDLSRYAAPAGNQGSQGSCSSWAIAQMKTIQEAIERGWSTSDPSHQMSPAFIYNVARAMAFGGRPAGYRLDGIFVTDGLRLLAAVGVSSLAAMPYDPDDNNRMPSAAAVEEADDYRIAEWSSIDLSRSDWLEQLKLHLSNNTPLIAVINVYPDFYFWSGDQDQVYDSSIGAGSGTHGVVLVGYDEARGAFKYLNSWGTEYGTDGYGWLDFDFADEVLWEAYYTVDIIAGEDPPASTLHCADGLWWANYATPDSAQACIDSGFDIETQFTALGNDKPLALAAVNPNPRVVDVLLTAGAEVGTAIFQVRTTEAAQTLVDAGAEATATLRYGKNPLHTHLDFPYVPVNLGVLRVLIDAGADRSARDDAGRTPLDYAEDCLSRSLLCDGKYVGIDPAGADPAPYTMMSLEDIGKILVGRLRYGRPRSRGTSVNAC